jgi:hypothetical protein
MLLGPAQCDGTDAVLNLIFDPREFHATAKVARRGLKCKE